MEYIALTTIRTRTREVYNDVTVRYRYLCRNRYNIMYLNIEILNIIKNLG